jgi:hypothetical protein
MSRRPDGATARSEWLRVRITPDGLAALDDARGELDRSEFVRRAIDAATQGVPASVAEPGPISGDISGEIRAAAPAREPAPAPERGRRQRLALGAHPFAPVEPYSLMCKCGYAARYH